MKIDEHPNMPSCPRCNGDKDHETLSTIEVAHTFQLGTRFVLYHTRVFFIFRYSEALNARSGSHPYEMCCFGIGITR